MHMMYQLFKYEAIKLCVSLFKIFLIVGMYLHYRMENLYLDSFSIGAHTLHSMQLLTD